MTLPKGKLSLADLDKLVFPYLPFIDDPRQVTLDYSTTTIQGNLAIATDPVLGIPLQFYGFFAVHYSATDVAMAGATPQYLTLGVYYPPETEEGWLTETMKQLGNEARLHNIKIVGGHTGGYDGLRYPLIATTCFGELQTKLPPPTEIEPGDVLIATGPVARETLWFIANVEPSNVDAILPQSDRKELAADLTPFSLIPIVKALPKESILLMHDLAEGGLATSLMELYATTKLGINIQYNDVPWDELAMRLFDFLNWNPLYCSSFGSFLVITHSEDADAILKKIKGLNRDAAIIGNFTKKKRILIEYPDKSKLLESGKDPYQRFTSQIH